MWHLLWSWILEDWRRDCKGKEGQSHERRAGGGALLVRADLRGGGVQRAALRAWKDYIENMGWITGLSASLRFMFTGFCGQAAE